MLGTGVFLTLLMVQFGSNVQPAIANNNLQADFKAAAVESNMHEFMEYVFQPTYNRLKPLMASPPAANQGWRAIKSDALILAEGGNLLLLRKPPEGQTAWGELSVAVRDAGGQLYRAARKRNFSECRRAYEQMLISCNSCHKRFAGGKHQLAP